MNDHPKRAFTLIELLVSIAIVAVLIGILVPLLAQMRNSARRAVCLNNARQIVLAIGVDSSSNGGRLPENRTLLDDSTYITWRRRFAEQELVPYGDVWVCPMHPGWGAQGEAGFSDGGVTCVGDVASSYALNGHVLWRLSITDDQAKRADTAIRRPSHTILLAETNRMFSHLRASPPMVANYYEDDPGPYGFWHEQRGIYGFQDGHVEAIRFLDTGSPDCRWHNGNDLTDDPFVPQTREEVKPHDHPDWKFLVPDVYRSGT